MEVRSRVHGTHRVESSSGYAIPFLTLLCATCFLSSIALTIAQLRYEERQDRINEDQRKKIAMLDARGQKLTQYQFDLVQEFQRPEYVPPEKLRIVENEVRAMRAEKQRIDSESDAARLRVPLGSWIPTIDTAAPFLWWCSGILFWLVIPVVAALQLCRRQGRDPLLGVLFAGLLGWFGYLFLRFTTPAVHARA